MKKILLVEDQADNQMVIEDIFEFDDLNAELVVVESAEDALPQVEQLGPILILMDVGLPGLSGIDATRILKSDPATREIPIWALTAHAMKAVKNEAMAAGCDDYVTKPINASDLAKRLRNFIDQLEIRNVA